MLHDFKKNEAFARLRSRPGMIIGILLWSLREDSNSFECHRKTELWPGIRAKDTISPASDGIKGCKPQGGAMSGRAIQRFSSLIVG